MYGGSRALTQSCWCGIPESSENFSFSFGCDKERLPLILLRCTFLHLTKPCVPRMTFKKMMLEVRAAIHECIPFKHTHGLYVFVEEPGRSDTHWVSFCKRCLGVYVICDRCSRTYTHVRTCACMELANKPYSEACTTRMSLFHMSGCTHFHTNAILCAQKEVHLFAQVYVYRTHTQHHI
jgi:hypothetical protein